MESFEKSISDWRDAALAAIPIVFLATMACYLFLFRARFNLYGSCALALADLYGYGVVAALFNRYFRATWTTAVIAIIARIALQCGAWLGLLKLFGGWALLLAFPASWILWRLVINLCVDRSGRKSDHVKRICFVGTFYFCTFESLTLATLILFRR